MREAERREEIRKFWKYMIECVIETGRRCRIVLKRNGRIGNSEVIGVLGKWGMDGVNENGEYLLDTSVERRLFLANTFFNLQSSTGIYGEGKMRGLSRKVGLIA